MGISSCGSLSLRRDIDCDKFCAVGWIGKPNWHSNFNREEPSFNYLRPSWITGIDEGCVNLIVLLIYKSQEKHNCGLIILKNIHNNHTNLSYTRLTSFIAAVICIHLILIS